MWIFFTVLCIIILLLGFVAVHKWRVTLQYNSGVFDVKVGGLTVYSSAEDKENEKQRAEKSKISYIDMLSNIKSLKQFYQDEKQEIADILKEMEKRNELIRLGISITFGFSDAAVTGIANGIIWATAYGAVSFVDKYVNIKDKTSIALYPVYTKSCFDLSVLIIFDTQLITAYYIAKRAKRLYKKYNT